MTFDADVVVVGGGLAGASTALALARRGVTSVVVEKADFPRDKPCGEGLLPHGLELLGALGLGDVVTRCGGQPFRGILYRCHGVVARGDFEGGAVGRGVQRLLLDDEVRKRAAATDGVTLIHGAVKDARADVNGDDGGVAVGLVDGRVLQGRFLVGADGPRSTVRHALGLDGGSPRRPRYALRQHFRLPAGSALPDRVEVNVVDGYELYVTPVGEGVVGVAALCEKHVLAAAAAGTGGKAADRLRALIDACAPVAERLDGAVGDGKALGCGPLRVRAKAVARDRAFLVGDAAGYVDAITGEGMSLALLTAHLAAEAIASVLHDEAPLHVARAAYARRRMRVFRDHALLTFGLVELARHKWFARRAIARLAAEPELFSRLLGVNNGTRALTSLGVADFAKLAVGKAPA